MIFINKFFIKSKSDYIRAPDLRRIGTDMKTLIFTYHTITQKQKNYKLKDVNLPKHDSKYK